MTVVDHTQTGTTGKGGEGVSLTSILTSVLHSDNLQTIDGVRPDFSNLMLARYLDGLKPFR